MKLKQFLLRNSITLICWVLWTGDFNINYGLTDQNEKRSNIVFSKNPSIENFCPVHSLILDKERKILGIFNFDTNRRENTTNTSYVKVEKLLKGSLDSIPSPSPSVKIQIICVKVCLRCKGKTLLGVVNKHLKTKSL